MAAKPRPLPPDITVTLTLPAPMVWKLEEQAEEIYGGIRWQDLAMMAIATSLRKRRGPQTDLSRDWEIYQLWRKRMPISKISVELSIAPKTVSTRLQAMGLRSVYEDYRKSNGSEAAKKGWETRRARREQLQKQADKAERDAREQATGVADQKKRLADERRRQRKVRDEEAA